MALSSAKKDSKSSNLISFESDLNDLTGISKRESKKSEGSTSKSKGNVTIKSDEISIAKSRRTATIKSDEISIDKSNKSSQSQRNKILSVKSDNVTTTQIDEPDKIIESVKEQCRVVKVPVSCKPPKISNLSLLSDDCEEIITIPAIERKKITTVQKINPKKTQTLVIKELKPIITVTRDNNKEIKKIKTPINKHLTTKTTVQRSTTTTTETTILIGKAGESVDRKNLKD